MKIVEEPILENGAKLVGYLHTPSPEMPQRTNRPAVLICPGGGYVMRSDREADPPALFFAARGYQVFLLAYSVGEGARNMQPLREISAAVCLMRKKAEEWRLMPDRIAVMGYSAGGHLAASLGVFYNRPELGCPNGENKPNAMLLCYPVITSNEFAHRGSLENVSGETDPARQAFWSLENHVTKDTPPAFLWHTYEDQDVPVENSLLFVNALRRAGVPCEFHMFQEGWHGLSICREESASDFPACAPWLDLCIAWLDRRFGWKR